MRKDVHELLRKRPGVVAGRCHADRVECEMTVRQQDRTQLASSSHKRFERRVVQQLMARTDEATL